LGLLSAAFAYVAIKELVGYVNLLHYKRQGIDIIYIPVFGAQYLLDHREHSSDPLHGLRDLVKKIRGFKNGVVAVNSLFSFHPVLIIVDLELAKDFYRLEIENFKRRKLMDDGLNTKNAFFFAGGKRISSARNYYGEFFNYSSAVSLGLPILEIFHHKYNRINYFSVAKKDGWSELNYTRYLEETFDGITHDILLGDPTLSERFRFNGIPFSTYVEIGDKKYFEAVTHPLNLITMGWAHKLRLIEASRTYFNHMKLIRANIKQIYQERLESGPKNRLNFIDLMISGDKKAQAEGRLDDLQTEDDIILNFLIFYSAGTDAAKSVLGSTVQFLSEQPKLAEDLYREIKKDILNNMSLEQALNAKMEINLDGCDLLNRFIKEALRRFSPGPEMLPRTATRNVKVGKIAVTKGTDITIPYYAFHHNDEIFEDPMTFNVDRWLPENEAKMPKGMYAPFILGNRSCIAKELALNMLRSGIISQLANFEINHADYKPIWNAVFSLSMEKTLVDIRKRTTL